jgi:hypothetical protein
VLRVNALLAAAQAGRGAFLFQLFKDVVHGLLSRKSIIEIACFAP